MTPPSPRAAAAEESYALEAKWRVFTRSIVAVLAASIVAVAAGVSAIAIVRLRQLALAGAERKAADLARFVARTAFVPLSLENPSMLARAVEPYADDPDLAYLTVTDAAGKAVYASRRGASVEPGLVTAFRPVVPPSESAAPGAPSEAVGKVAVGVSLARPLAAARRAVVAIALGSLALLLAAVAAGLALISGMTRRLKELVGEARLARSLKEANEQLEAFSYSVAHDLRAPLRHVSGFIDILQSRISAGLDAESRRYMTVIAESAVRMGALIDDLLSFSRTSRTELRTSRVSLRVLAEQAIADLESEAAGRTIDWRLAALPEVEGDPTLLRLVFQNLVGNALKFTAGRESAVIEIGQGEPRPGGESVFYVRDNGVGFDMRYAGKLFGVFQRLHRQEDFKGTGIGLANVRRIIYRHGGETWAEGRPGEGATFYFSLPTIREAKRR